MVPQGHGRVLHRVVRRDRRFVGHQSRHASDVRVFHRQRRVRISRPRNRREGVRRRRRPERRRRRFKRRRLARPGRRDARARGVRHGRPARAFVGPRFGRHHARARGPPRRGVGSRVGARERVRAHDRRRRGERARVGRANRRRARLPRLRVFADFSAGDANQKKVGAWDQVRDATCFSEDRSAPVFVRGPAPASRRMEDNVPAHLRSFEGARRARRREPPRRRVPGRGVRRLRRRGASPPAAAAAAGGAWAFESGVFESSGGVCSAALRRLFDTKAADLKPANDKKTGRDKKTRSRLARARGAGHGARGFAGRLAFGVRGNGRSRARLGPRQRPSREPARLRRRPQRRAQGDAARLRRDRRASVPPHRRRGRARFFVRRRPTTVSVRLAAFGKRKRNRTRDRM